MSKKLEGYINEATKNIREDRALASKLLSDLIQSMAGQSDHQSVGVIAAKYLVSLRFPINPVSTIPTNGIAMFEKKTGMDNKIICFFENFDELLNSSILFFNIS